MTALLPPVRSCLPRLNIVVFCTAFLSLFSLEGVAQSKWEISFDLGTSLPVGKFGNSNAVESRIYSIPSHPGDKLYIEGYSFERNGFARAGWYAGSSVSFHWTRQWDIFLKYQFSSFSVNEEILARDLSSYYQLDNDYYQSDYQIHHLMPGLGYKIQAGAFLIHVQVMAGLTGLSFPFYKFIANYTTVKIEYVHEGERPMDYSFGWGATASLKLPLNQVLLLSFNMGYMNSAFDFHYNPRWVPGGSGNFEYDDQLTYQAFTVGVSFSILF